MRGRPPKPTKLKILTGNPGRRPLNGAEPIPGAGVPTCPTWLDAEAKAEWRRVCKDLAEMGLLAGADRKQLASLCQAWAEFRLATRTLQKEGREQKTDNGYIVPHPAAARQMAAMKMIDTLSVKFGLDPSSRSRLQVAPKTGERSELEQFIGG